MSCIPVIDIQHGGAVRAVAGDRARYRPLRSPICPNADPLEAAINFARQGFKKLYVADLDCIAGGPPNYDLYRSMASEFEEMWIDAGWKNATDLMWIRSNALFGIRPVLGLESLDGPNHLNDLTLAGNGAVFSLDLKNGLPITRVVEWQEASPVTLARHWMGLGGKDVVVLDLASVGVAKGPASLAACQLIREQFPRLVVTTGGGVRSISDLTAIRDAGCRHALVSTALHQGTLSFAEAISWQGDERPEI